MQSNQAMQDELIRSLQSAQVYPHRVDRVQHLETHISHVLLAGDYAYKVKKPVDLGFLDFSTLAKRRHFCEEELRLNRRLAPDIYLGLVTITGTARDPVLGGDGPVIEYAVKMRRFPQSGLLTQVPLTHALMARTAQRLAAFHAGIERAGQRARWGRAVEVCAPMLEDFEQIRTRVPDSTRSPQLASLEGWTRSRCEQLGSILEQRKHQGFIRECHGDLHLGNMALLDDRLIIFDGIEFSEPLRWIDTMSDVAFLCMDLVHTGRAELAWGFLNAYLEITGDYAGVQVLDLYQVYRAMVRAKVAAIRLGQPAVSDLQNLALMSEYLSYVELAERFTCPSQPGVIITMGVSGSGKSTLTQPLLEQLQALRIRSDVERKRLFGLRADDKTQSGKDQGIYQPQVTEATYAQLLALTQTLTTSGHTVIVDATFLKRWQRAPFFEYAANNRLPILILAMDAAPELLRDRVAKRQSRGSDASEADLAILESQLAAREPLSDAEEIFALRLNSGKPVPIPTILERWKWLQ